MQELGRRLVALVGRTATGKTEAGIAVAQALGGEVVGADAFQVYRGLDIGTAKPSQQVRAMVPHHLIDVLDPTEELTLARYLDLAHQSLNDIWSRGRLPVLVGGSGQYVWALIEGWQVPRVAPDPALRAGLEAFAAEHGAQALHLRLKAADPVAAGSIDYRNVRRVIRALEVIEREGRPLSACRLRRPLDAAVLVIGLTCSRDQLHGRIDERVDAMFEAGLANEVEALRRGGWGDTRPVRSGIGYKEASAYLDGELSLDEAIRRTKTATHRLARNQGAWFKDEDERIHWVEAGLAAPGACLALVRSWLAAGV